MKNMKKIDTTVNTNTTLKAATFKTLDTAQKLVGSTHQMGKIVSSGDSAFVAYSAATPRKTKDSNGKTLAVIGFDGGNAIVGSRTSLTEGEKTVGFFRFSLNADNNLVVDSADTPAGYRTVTTKILSTTPFADSSTGEVVSISAVAEDGNVYRIPTVLADALGAKFAPGVTVNFLTADKVENGGYNALKVVVLKGYSRTPKEATA